MCAGCGALAWSEPPDSGGIFPEQENSVWRHKLKDREGSEPPPLKTLGLPPAPVIPSKLPSALSLHELEHLEAIIEADKGVFVRVGAALVLIRDGRGYKLRGFQTFEQYVEQQFGFSRQHAYRHIDAFETVQKLEKGVENVTKLVTNPVTSEGQAREIKQLGTEKVVDQLRTALHNNSDPVVALKKVVGDLRRARRAGPTSRPAPKPRYAHHETAKHIEVVCQVCSTWHLVDAETGRTVRFRAAGRS